MKICLVCGATYASAIHACPACKHSPKLLEGFDSYAPDFAYEGGGFKSDYFSELARLEESNFWFQSRNQLIIWAIEKYAPQLQSLLEIGCGTAFVLSGISKKFPNTALSGSEIFVTGLGFAAKRLPSVKFVQMDARAIPFKNEFDAIGAFDVVEHIKEDEQVLSQIHAALNPQGLMFLTVPQHEWLWSTADDYACHVRRYTAKTLHQKISRAGFQVVRSTSFISALLPAMMASRLLQKRTRVEDFDASSELKISPWLNAVFSRVLQAELAMIKKGFDFSVGGSRLIVAKKA